MTSRATQEYVRRFQTFPLLEIVGPIIPYSFYFEIMPQVSLDFLEISQHSSSGKGYSEERSGKWEIGEVGSRKLEAPLPLPYSLPISLACSKALVFFFLPAINVVAVYK